MSNGKSHYEVMGLPDDATPEQIKKRFRQLAREYHPDLHRDRPEMHEVFVRISQAYEILSDPNRRATYDLDRRLQARRETEFRSGSYGSAPFTQRPPSNSSAGRADAGGNGFTPPGAARPPSDRTRDEREKKRQAVNRLMDDARVAFQRGHLAEAKRLCQEVLEVSRVGEAYQMLGDIASRQGRWNAALDNYTLAMQLLPNEPRLRRKFEEAAAHVGGAGRVAGSRGGGGISGTGRASYQLGLACFGCAVILFLMFWGPSLQSQKLDLPFVDEWTVAHFASMMIVGFLSGAVLASSTLLDTFQRQLVEATVGTDRFSLPIGLVLGFLGMFFFPLALLVYLAATHFKGGRSPSISGVLAAVVMLTLGFFLAAPEGAQIQTLVLGGNVIFITALVGWLVGDWFRPGWAG